MENKQVNILNREQKILIEELTSKVGRLNQENKDLRDRLFAFDSQYNRNGTFNNTG